MNKNKHSENDRKPIESQGHERKATKTTIINSSGSPKIGPATKARPQPIIPPPAPPNASRKWPRTPSFCTICYRTMLLSTSLSRASNPTPCRSTTNAATGQSGVWFSRVADAGSGPAGRQGQSTRRHQYPSQLSWQGPVRILSLESVRAQVVPKHVEF